MSISDRIASILQTIRGFITYKFIFPVKIWKIEKGKRIQKVSSSLVLFLQLVILIIIINYGYSIDSSGFGDYVSPTGEFFRGKTFWDWLDLLIVPLLIGYGGWYLNKTSKEREEALIKTRQQDDALQRYFDSATKLLTSEIPGDKFEMAIDILRARTLTTLAQLDGTRKGYLLRFILEAELLFKENPYYMEIKRADFSSTIYNYDSIWDSILSGISFHNSTLYALQGYDSELNGINFDNSELMSSSFFACNFEYSVFRNASMEKVTFKKCELGATKFHKTNLRNSTFVKGRGVGSVMSEAILIGSKFRSIDLNRALFVKAKLQKTQFINLDLSEADFTGANVKGVVFDNVNLTNAIISERQLRKTKMINGTIMPDGTIRQ